MNADLVLGDPSISILEGVILPWGEPTGYLRKVVLPTLAKAFKFDLNAPVGRAQRRGAAGAALRRARAVQVPDRRRAGPGRVRDRLGRRAPERRAPLPGVDQRRGADGARGVHDRAALPDLRRQAAQGREPGGAGERARASATWWTSRSSGRSSSSRASRCAAAQRANGRRGSTRRSPGRSSRKWWTGCASSATSGSTTSRSAAARRRSPAARRSASGWRPRSAPAWSACSTSSTSRASACTSATTSACSPRCAASATWATRSSWSSTTRTPSQAADHVIDLGPRAGPLRRRGHRRGDGRGHPAAPERRSPGATCGTSSGCRCPAGRREAPAKHRLRIVGARANNLQNLTVDIPLGVFIAVTGVSGSGKSTLVTDILYQSLARHFYRAKVVPGAHTRDRGARPDRQGHRHRPEPDRPHAALESRPPTPGCSPRSASSSPSCPTPRCAATGRAASRST